MYFLDELDEEDYEIAIKVRDQMKKQSVFPILEKDI